MRYSEFKRKIEASGVGEEDEVQIQYYDEHGQRSEVLDVFVDEDSGELIIETEAT